VTTVVGCRRSAGGGSGQPGRNLLPAWRLLAPRLGAEASALFVTERATPVLPLLFPLFFGLHGCLGCYLASWYRQNVASAADFAAWHSQRSRPCPSCGAVAGAL